MTCILCPGRWHPKDGYDLCDTCHKRIALQHPDPPRWQSAEAFSAWRAAEAEKTYRAIFGEWVKDSLRKKVD